MVVERIVFNSIFEKKYLLINIVYISISNRYNVKTLLFKSLGLLFYDKLKKCKTKPMYFYCIVYYGD